VSGAFIMLSFSLRTKCLSILVNDERLWSYREANWLGISAEDQNRHA